MKEEEKHRKFHEALLKMLYPPPSDSDKEDEEKKHDESELNLIKLLNDPPENGEEIENEEPSPSSSDDNMGGDGKLTRAQRKRLRKRKLKEADSRRRKIIGPLLPASEDDIDQSHGSVNDVSNAPESVRRNSATNASADLSHGSGEFVNNAPDVRQNAAPNVSEEEPSSSNKKKLKLKQRRKSKKMAVAKSTPSSIISNQNQGLKTTVDDKVDGDP